jgi:DNA-3-methyladenine glycosylase II
VKREILVGVKKFSIGAVPPFDFDLTAKIFSGGDRQIQNYEKGRYWQVIRVNGRVILIAVKAVGSVNKPRLQVELASNEEISTSEKKSAENVVRTLFNLDLDLKPFYKQISHDEPLKNAVQKLIGLKSPGTPTVFEALVDSVVEQQISLNAANSMETRIVKTFGEQLTLKGEVFYAFPTPQQLGSASIEQLKKCGLSSRKAEYIQEISKLVMRGKLDLEELKRCDDGTRIVGELDKIRGIGVWTAEMTMLRGMHKLEALPADDLGLRRIISHYYCGDAKISGDEVRRISAKWGKWKGLAAFYLIMAEMIEHETGRTEGDSS